MIGTKDIQLLFLNFFEEGFRFLGCSPGNVRVAFKDSLNFQDNVNAVFSDNLLIVNVRWLLSLVRSYKPTIIRNYAYYYAYGFVVYHNTKISIPKFPYCWDAQLVSMALFLLNGIPINDEIINACGNKITFCLKNFKDLECRFIEAISPTDGRRAIKLSLSEETNKTLFNTLRECKNIAASRKLIISKGTRENPFDNVNEAVTFIKDLEKEEVKKDKFLNSFFCGFSYAYDYGFKDNNSLFGSFVIPWACAKSAHRNNNFPEKSFIVTQLNPLSVSPALIEWLYDGESVDLLKRPVFSLKPNLARRRFLFRGQSQEYLIRGTDIPTCKPGKYREEGNNDSVAARIKAYEMMSLIVQHPLVKKLGIEGIKVFNEILFFQLNLQGLAQHYYNSTDLLDLTSDIDVAKFFATTEYRKNDDEYRPCGSDGDLGVLFIYDMRLPDDFVNSELPQLSTIGKQYVFHRSGLQSGFLLKMPPDLNLHDLPNVYRIYFRQNKKVSQEIFERANEGKVYFPDDVLSNYWKKIKDLPNSELNVSLKARELYLILHSDEVTSLGEVDKTLLKEGFKLGENLWPEISKQFFLDFHADIKNVWKDFVKDIYFYGTEGAFMKSALEDAHPRV